MVKQDQKKEIENRERRMKGKRPILLSPFSILNSFAPASCEQNGVVTERL